MTTSESEAIESAPKENLYDLIRNKLEKLSAVKFAAYRVACKLRVLQKHLKLTFVDYNILVRVFNTHQLPFGVETEQISIDDARKVLVAIYQLISVYHFNESTIEETVETFLRFLGDILQGPSTDEFDVHSFKIMLFALSNAKLPEKYRCFFRQITSPNVIASQVKLTELLEILLKLPNHFDNVDSFHLENIPACVQSCLDHTHDGIVREDIFVNWMSREPQTLVWLPTLHRLIATETVRHEAQCNTCKVYPVIGMRYRCLRCFNYDLCQTCFFTGDHGQKHDGSHPIEEYCKQVTPFEDLKAFMEFVKLKAGKNELRRKERYLTIERSKSFSDAPTAHSNTLLNKNGQHSLNRAEQKKKKASLEDVAPIVPKNETNSTLKNLISNDQSVPREGTKKKKKLVADPSPVPDESAKSKKGTPVHIEPKSQPSSKATPVAKKQENDADDDGEAPMLMPKQHKPMKKSALMKNRTEELIESEHYQLPPKDEKENKPEEEDDDEYRPPLPPKQRYQNETSRALVYDFIGSELQELRATLAQFDKTSSTA